MPMKTLNNAMRREAGSTLIFAMVLLGVLSVMGVAAVALSSQERANAAIKGRYDAQMECANAAQGFIWSEIQSRGVGIFGSTLQVDVVPRNLSNGTQLAAPIHYDQSGTVRVSDMVFTGTAGGASFTGEFGGTNAGAGSKKFNKVYGITARCTDPQGRQFEVELSLRFGLL
jgi:hypothetical protein